jgi:hypothetical protein
MKKTKLRSGFTPQQRSLLLRWVKALRSGRYVQAQNALREKDFYTKRVSYCCLGVLCNVSDLGRWKHHTLFVPFDEPMGGGVFSLPPSIRQAAGLTEAHQETLMVMNDVKQQNFTNIADWIERNILKLPKTKTR